MLREYSKMYSLLVQNEGDLQGHIAYSLYKQAKILHIETHQGKNGGVKPTDSELVKFNEFAENNIEFYKMKAEAIFQVLIEGIMEETVKQVQEEILDNVSQIMQTEVVDKLKAPSKWHQLWFGGLQSVIGSIMAAFLLFILALFFLVKDVGMYEIIKKIYYTEPAKTEHPIINKIDTLNPE